MAEMEVPEIYDNIIENKSYCQKSLVLKTKVAVFAADVKC